MLFTLKGIIAISVFLFNLFLALLVLIRNPRCLINKTFFLIGTVLASWALFLFFYEFPYVFSSLFWIKATYLMATSYVVLAFFFSFIFPATAFKRARIAAGFFVMLYYLLSIWLLFFTKSWVVDVVIDPARGIQTVLGPAYLWWALGAWIFVTWTVVNFIIKTRLATPIQKIQLGYFWMGFILFGIGVSVIDIIIPLAFHDTRAFIFGTLTNLFFSGATAYTIIKHRFMDIRLVVARSVAYFFLALILGIVYAAILFFIVPLITKEAISPLSLFVSAALALLITFSSQPLLTLLKKITNRIFYKEGYNETELLHNLTLIMASTVYLYDLTQTLLYKILTKMRIGRGAFILVENKKISHLACRGYVNKPEFAEEDLDKIIKQSQITIFDELPENSLKEVMRRLEISTIIPLRTRTEFEDVLILGEKLSGEPYTNQDVRLLDNFALEVAVAIENASNVERLMRLDELKSEFITVVSHQLRTPLSVARWNFELLLEEAFGKIPEKADKILQDTYLTLMTLNQGLNNLMTVLEIEEGKIISRLEDIEINEEIIKEAIADLNREIQVKNIAIKLRLSFKRIICIDSHKIKRVFGILLDNAIRYSPIGSTITISTFWQEKGGQNEVLFSIEDEGIGITPKNRSLIFQKFFRGEEAKKMSPAGFGLGLFMAKKYVELHGGRLWVEQKEGPGSIFCFTIPILEKNS